MGRHDQASRLLRSRQVCLLLVVSILIELLAIRGDAVRNKTSTATPPGYFAELSLRDYLLVDQDYQPTLRPVRHATDVIPVDIGLYVISLRKFNPSLQRLHLQGYSQISWTDSMLTWKEDDSRFPNIIEIMLPAEKVWKPEVFLYYGGTLDVAAGPLVTVRSNGSVTRRIYQEYEANCRSSYASDFDAVGGDGTTFECNIEFAVVGHHFSDTVSYPLLNLTTSGSGAHLLDSCAENQCWRIVRSTSFRPTQSNSVSTQRGSGLVFQFQIQPNTPAIDTRPLVASLCKTVFKDVGFDYAGMNDNTSNINVAPAAENTSRFKQFVIALMASSCLMFLLPAPYNFMAGTMQLVGYCICGTMQVASEKVFDETITIVALFAQLTVLLLLAVMYSVEYEHIIMPKRHKNFANKNQIIRPPPALLRRFAAISLKFMPQNLWAQRNTAKMQHSFQPLVDAAVADGLTPSHSTQSLNIANSETTPISQNSTVPAPNDAVEAENSFSAVAIAEWCRVVEAFRKVLAMTYLIVCVFILAI